MTNVRVGLISDTHGRLHDGVIPAFGGVDAIIHAGDVGDESILDRLNETAPTHAVCGNVDYPSVQMPLMKTVPFPFGNIGVAHGHEFPRGKEPRSRALYKAFEDQDVRVIVFGHSHQQYVEFYQDTFLINPGAAGLPRFRLQSSVAILEWNETTNLLGFCYIPLKW